MTWHVFGWIVVALLIIFALFAYFAAGMASRALTREDLAAPNKMFAVAALLAVLLLVVGCTTPGNLPPPEPVIVTKEVAVAVPMPCAALAKLGSEPSYADSDAALATAPNIFESTRMLLTGRLQRIKRLTEYGAARVACEF